ncbi:MAG: 4Fe-4S dicluster domain-containing protein [Desulfurococcales archaeon]|nr:4Fe-4S dicluster domain-containing protein [Desulfurococcales archaeon]
MSVLEKPLKIEDLLQRNIWDVDEEPHIEIPLEGQEGLKKRALALLCPAGCYTLVGDRLIFSYEGCVECGLCRIITPPDKIKWSYPRSGKGVTYRYT